MATRRTRRGLAGPGPTRTTVIRATAIAEQLRYEVSSLLELYRKRESFTSDLVLSDGRLVSVPPPSSQQDSGDKVWCLHSALLQCRSLLERAIAKEEEELGRGKRGDYETKRKMVRDTLSLLLINTGELLKASDGAAAITPTSEGLELDGPSALFELKLWVFRIFKEVDYWTRTAIATLQALQALQALPTAVAKECVRTTRARSLRSARR